MNRFLSILIIFILLLAAAVAAQAVTIDMVTVADRGNAPDTTGYGEVDYTYQIGKFEITAGQYAAFLNAVARNSNPYGLSIPNASRGWQITSTINNNVTVYTATYPNQPINRISWLDAARFCNWMANGQPNTGVENLLTTENGSYYLNGATGDSFTGIRNSNATWVIPSENEWYKAAYYDPKKNGQGMGGYWLYATMSDDPPNNIYPSSGANSANYNNAGAPLYTTEVGSFSNSKSAYGTFDQDGNVSEWMETPAASPPQPQGNRFFRGGNYDTAEGGLISTNRQSVEESDPVRGFRIAYVPEPNVIVIILSAAIYFITMRKKHWNNVP